MDNDRTEGGRVKLHCEVIKTYWDNVDSEKGKRPKSPNLNCRVETLGALIADFGAVERQWVVEMGLGGLLFLAGKRLPRMLCYWLLTKLDPIRHLLVVNSKCRYQLLPQSVHWVFGLPCGGKKVPDVNDTVANGRTIQVFEKYGSYTSQGYRCLAIQNVLPDVIKKHNPDDDSAEFKLAFLILVLGDFLCPSSCSKLSHDLWPAVTVFNEAQEYDWCGFLLDNLMSYGRLFCQKFYRDGYAKGSGGCTYFLALFYIDHLDREPVGWGVFPRIKAWSNDGVNAVKFEDRLRDENGEIISRGDFGKLGCINVAYGEQHPRAGRDTMGPSSGIDEALTAVLNAVRNGGVPQTSGACRVGSGVDIDPNGIFPSSKVRRKLGPADKSNPQTRMAAKKGRMEAPNSGRSDPLDEPVVEEDHSDSESDREGPPGFNTIHRTVGDDPLANLVFSQDIFGAEGDGGALSQSQGCTSDSLFHSLYQDFVVGPKLFDDADDLGDGIVVEGMPRNGSMINVEPESRGDPMSVQLESTENLAVDKENAEENAETRGGADDENAETRGGADDENAETRGGADEENAEMRGGADEENPHTGTGAVGQEEGGPNEAKLGTSDSRVREERCDGGRDDGNAVSNNDRENPPIVDDSSSQAGRNSPLKSRPKREKRPSLSVKNKDFYIDHLPRSNPNSRPRLTKFVMTTGALIADAKNCTGEEVFRVHELNIPMIQCDGMFADVMNCYSVLSPHCGGVDDSYIRTAAKLYTKMWKEKYDGHGVRYMIDPSFALKIQQEKGAPALWADTAKLCKVYAKDFIGFSSDRFNVIFVPILSKSHWWCVGVSVNTTTVWVIDSVSLRCGVKEKQLLRKVLNGVELFLQTLEPAYQVGTIAGWPCKTVQMECQEDGNTCGVRMLLAIKSCADRFLSEFVLRSPVEEERQWLLNDDVMHPLNEAKAEVRKKIEDHMSEVA